MSSYISSHVILSYLIFLFNILFSYFIFCSAFKNLEDFQKKFKKEIIDELSGENKKSERKTEQPRSRADRLSEDDDPLRVGPARGGYRNRQPPDW